MTDTAASMRKAYSTSASSVVEVTAQCMEYCRHDPHNAIITVNEDAATAAQASAERYQQQSSYGLWDGIPYVAKDNIAVATLPWTAGIDAYRHRIATDDADLIAWLKQQGAILIGKSNLHEAALGTSSDNPWFGQCHHPLCHGFSPGGSSGGSAVAVAAGYVPLALGTDTMGSVRIPAVYCGVYGYKPGYGMVSGNGVTPLSAVLDTIGLIAASAKDLQLYGSSLSGIDADTTNHTPLVIGTLSKSATADCSDEVAHCYRDAIEHLIHNSADQGVQITEVEWFDSPTLNRRAGLTLCVDEAYREHEAALLQSPDRFSSELIKLLTFGRNLDAAKLDQAHTQIAQLKSQVQTVWSAVDLVLTPATPCATHRFNDTVPMNLADYTAVANLTGVPSTALPWGRCSNGLSLGLQLIGKSGGDNSLLAQTRVIDNLLHTHAAK